MKRFWRLVANNVNVCNTDEVSGCLKMVEMVNFMLMYFTTILLMPKTTPERLTNEIFVVSCPERGKRKTNRQQWRVSSRETRSTFRAVVPT